MGTENKEIWENPKAFRQQVSLAAVQVASLADGELATALAYELEPFSKIPSADADVAWRESPASNASVKIYDVAVMRRRGNSPRHGHGIDGRRAGIFAAVAALLAVLAVAADCAWLKCRETNLRRDLAARSPLDAEIRSLDAQAASLRNQARQLREKREREAAAQQRVERMRRAFPDAMGTVATVCGGRTTVKEFASSAPFEISMCAVAPNADAAVAIMAKLDAAAAKKSWRLEPGAIEASATGATATFSCRLKFNPEPEEAQ